MIVRGNLEIDAKNLINYINPAIQGLEKLKNTYDNDSHISGEIAIFISTLKEFNSHLGDVSLIVDSYSELENNAFSNTEGNLKIKLFLNHLISKIHFFHLA